MVIRRLKRSGLVAGFIAAVMMGLLGADRRPAHDRSADAETVQLPARHGQALATRSYLGRDGAALIQLLVLTTDLPDTSPSAVCQDLAMRLDHVGGPDVLAAAALAAPEPSLRDSALGHIAAVGRYLAACRDGQPLAQAAREVRYTAVLLRRLIDRERT